jgi:hypothetical protein
MNNVMRRALLPLLLLISSAAAGQQNRQLRERCSAETRDAGSEIDGFLLLGSFQTP